MKTINILMAGLGGQGVLLGSNLLSDLLLTKGYCVKKSEIHGMSQRGGSVESHIRFGDIVHSPVIPDGECDFLISFNENEGKRLQHKLKDINNFFSLSEDNIKLLNNINCKNTLLITMFIKDGYNCRSDFHSITKGNLIDFINTNFPKKIRKDNVNAVELGYA